jgi:capsular polysaccharide biosynthesis protein
VRYVPVDEIDSTVEAAPAALRQALRRWLWLIVSLTVLAGVFAFALSSLEKVKYTSRAQVFLSSEGRFDAFAGSYNPDPQRYVQTEADSVGSAAILNAVRTALKLPLGANLTLSAEPELGSDLLLISATADSSADATRVANAVVAAYQTSRQDQVDAAVKRAETQANKDVNRLADIHTRAAAYGDGIASVEAALPYTDTAGAPKLNALIAVLATLILSCGLAALLEFRRNRRARAARRIKSVLDAPLLGVLPNFKTIDGISTVEPGSKADTSIEVLSRATLLAARRADVSSVLIAPADPAASAFKAAVNIALRSIGHDEPAPLLLLPPELAAAGSALRGNPRSHGLAVDLLADAPGAQGVSGAAALLHGALPGVALIPSPASFDKASAFRLLEHAESVVLVCSIGAREQTVRDVREQLELVGAYVLGFVLVDAPGRREKRVEAKPPPQFGPPAGRPASAGSQTVPIPSVVMSPGSPSGSDASGRQERVTSRFVPRPPA